MMLLPAFAGIAFSAASLVLSRPAPHQTRLLGLDSSKRKLTFDANGKFKIVSFSDMHFGERWGNGSWADWGPANDAATQVCLCFRGFPDMGDILFSL
jgi:hypothetical protein